VRLAVLHAAACLRRELALPGWQQRIPAARGAASAPGTGCTGLCCCAALCSSKGRLRAQHTTNF
jgi:hypothetical protein